MSRVLFLYEGYEPTNAEAFRTLQYISEKRNIDIKKCRSIDVKTEDINWCDVIYSVRSRSVLESSLSDYCRKLGKFWIFLLDDDLLTYKLDKAREKTIKLRNKEMLHTLSNTDCLISVNERLAKKYSNLTKTGRYILTDTSFNASSMTKPEITEGKIKIALYATGGRTDMFEKYIRPAIPLLSKRYGRGGIAIYLLALKPDLREYEDKIEIHYVPQMSFEDFLQYMSEAHFDIGLTPLDDSEFAQYKYFNHYVEFTRAGAAGIYSDCYVYRNVVQNGFNGILCENTPEAWFAAISELIENPEKRLEIARNAQKYALENFDRDNLARKLLAELPELENYKAPEKKANSFAIWSMKAKYYFFLLRCRINAMIIYISEGNFSAVITKLKTKLKRG